MKISPNIIWTGEFLELTNLPLPISVNNFANKTTIGGKHYHTKERQWHDREWEVWRWQNYLPRAKNKMIPLFFGDKHESFKNRNAKKIIRLEFFWKKKWFTDKLKKRNLDFSNFIKASEDQVANMLDINDCYFGEIRTFPYHCKKEESFRIKIWKPVDFPGMI